MNSALKSFSTDNISWNGLFWFALVVAASLPVFWYGMVYLSETWMTPEYSHGPLIPLISLYLFLRELRDKEGPATGSDSRWPGLVVLALGLALGVLGTSAQMPDFVAYGIIVWTSGLVLLTMGWSEGRRHQLPVLHLVFMLPLPAIIYFKMSSFLQGISSEIGVAIVAAMGIPVYLEGNIIDLGVYKLHVADACSGLRYLFPILSFSYLTAILYRGPYWHKFVLFAAAAPLAVLMNSFRIGVIGILVNSYGIEHVEGFTHFFEGWVIFLLCVVILFLMALVLQQTTRNPLPLAEAIDLDFKDILKPTSGLLEIGKPTMMAIGAFVSVAIVGSFLVSPSKGPAELDRVSFKQFPLQIGQWYGETETLEPDVEVALGADDYINATYINVAERTSINFFSAFYEEQSKGEGLHTPDVCLPGSGWEIYNFGTKDVSFPDTVYGDFKLNRAIIQKGLSRQLVYYFFEQRGKRMTNDYIAKLSVVWDGVTMGRTDGAMVRLVTPLRGPEDEAAADERLLGFMAEILPSLPRHLPE